MSLSSRSFKLLLLLLVRSHHHTWLLRLFNFFLYLWSQTLLILRRSPPFLENRGSFSVITAPNGAEKKIFGLPNKYILLHYIVFNRKKKKDIWCIREEDQKIKKRDNERCFSLKKDLPQKKVKGGHTKRKSKRGTTKKMNKISWSCTSWSVKWSGKIKERKKQFNSTSAELHQNELNFEAAAAASHSITRQTNKKEKESQLQNYYPDMIFLHLTRWGIYSCSE